MYANFNCPSLAKESVLSGILPSRKEADVSFISKQVGTQEEGIGKTGPIADYVTTNELMAGV